MRGLRVVETSFPTAFIPEEGPDEAEGGNDLVAIDFFVLPVGGSFFGDLSLTALSLMTSRAWGPPAY
jgi:hypothetical protein